MVQNKKKGFKLPLSLRSVTDAIGGTATDSEREQLLIVLVDSALDPALRLHAKSALRPQAKNVRVVVQSYRDTRLIFPEETTLVVLLAADAPVTGALLIQALRQQLPAVAVTLDATQLMETAEANNQEIDPLSVISTKLDSAGAGAHEELFRNLGSWVVRKLPEERLSLARALPFIREPLVQETIQATAVQNAAISVAFFLPGADLPLLTVNQIKLFLQIAALYGVEIDNSRLKEIAVLVVSGFGMRALARKLVGLVPVFGWAVRGLVGYTGTLAVGKAADEYCKRGGDPKELLAGFKRDGSASEPTTYITLE
ncbi:MAG: hypothetical protein LBS98_02650 [Coriobacteriales bacterium]|jgi:uncharacterized protein (DUF697 family)|nr:hypothetical protein [Coriobacteriales bacterium]